MPVVPRKSSPDLVWAMTGRATRPSGPAAPDATGWGHGRPACQAPRSPCCPAAWAARGSSRGCCTASRRAGCPGVAADAEVTVIANTADDLWVHGLKVCPDLDTVMYTLGDGIDPERGWGRRDETWSVKDELAAYGVEPTWFGLGDRDIATHLVRTQMLDAGYPLSAGDRGALPALARPASGRRPAAADDRRPGRDPRRHRRPRVAERPPGGALPGVLGPAARRGPGRGGRRRRARRVHARPGRHRRDHRRRPGAAAAVQPGRLGRHHPRRPAGPRGAGRHPRAGGRPLPHRRRQPRARHGRAAAHLDRRRGQRRRRRPPLRRPRPTAASSTAGWSTSRTPTSCPGCTRPGWPRPPYPSS